MLELEVMLDWACCVCGSPMGATLKCEGEGWRDKDAKALVKVPCPSCHQNNQVIFTPDDGTSTTSCPRSRSAAESRCLRIINDAACGSVDLKPSVAACRIAKPQATLRVECHGKTNRQRRRRSSPIRVYGSKLASKFINCLMWQGKKPTAMRIFYGALDQIKKRMPDANPIEVFTQAVENVKPPIEVRSKRVGGATYQVPMQVNKTRQQSLSIRWIIGAARGKAGRPMFLRLADELMAAYRREGEAMDQAREHHQDGRIEQGVRPLRVVDVAAVWL